MGAYIADLGQDDVLNPKDVEERKGKPNNRAMLHYGGFRKDFVENYISNPSKEMDCTRIDICSYVRGSSCIGKRQVEICWEEGANTFHGSTKGYPSSSTALLFGYGSPWTVDIVA